MNHNTTHDTTHKIYKINIQYNTIHQYSTHNAISTLVGEEIKRKCNGLVAAPNGSLYGIPLRARRVIKFNPIDKSITEIGPDFGDDGRKWRRGAMTDSGIIYCIP